MAAATDVTVPSLALQVYRPFLSFESGKTACATSSFAASSTSRCLPQTPCSDFKQATIETGRNTSLDFYAVLKKNRLSAALLLWKQLAQGHKCLQRAGHRISALLKHPERERRPLPAPASTYNSLPAPASTYNSSYNSSYRHPHTSHLTILW